MCYIYIRLLFGIACLAYHTAIKFALYQPLYPEFIVNYCFDIKRAAAGIACLAYHTAIKFALYQPLYILNSLLIIVSTSNELQPHLRYLLAHSMANINDVSVLIFHLQ